MLKRPDRPDEVHPELAGLEVGMALGLDFPDDARRLLDVAVSEEGGADP